jgi:hypothetical protein
MLAKACLICAHVAVIVTLTAREGRHQCLPGLNTAARDGRGSLSCRVHSSVISLKQCDLHIELQAMRPKRRLSVCMRVRWTACV